MTDLNNFDNKNAKKWETIRKLSIIFLIVIRSKEGILRVIFSGNYIL